MREVFPIAHQLQDALPFPVTRSYSTLFLTPPLTSGSFRMETRNDRKTSDGADASQSVIVSDERTASGIFIDSLLSQIDGPTVSAIVAVQREALARFEKTNEMLSKCSALSASRLEVSAEEWLSRPRRGGNSCSTSTSF